MKVRRRCPSRQPGTVMERLPCPSRPPHPLLGLVEHLPCPSRPPHPPLGLVEHLPCPSRPPHPPLGLVEHLPCPSRRRYQTRVETGQLQSGATSLRRAQVRRMDVRHCPPLHRIRPAN